MARRKQASKRARCANHWPEENDNIVVSAAEPASSSALEISQSLSSPPTPLPSTPRPVAITSPPVGTATTTTTTSANMSLLPPLERIFIISLGNPSTELANTLHSAGHMALRALRDELVQSGHQPPFSSEKLGGTRAQASLGPRYRLLESPTFMNLSGGWVARVWNKEIAGNQSLVDKSALIVLHDDLEEAPGTYRVRNWARSHRGHNGLRSIQGAGMKTPPPGARWARISIGIGRPFGREKDVVADFVLKPMSPAQKRLIDGIGQKLLSAIKTLEHSWDNPEKPKKWAV